ncbi:MAG: hypothetical protein KGL02_03960 [Acidobacteriota bacterium]|nr:hypothetical protein [Acidobacteriota bacterium]
MAQQVEKGAPRIVRYLKMDAARRGVDLHPAVPEFLRQYRAGKFGLLFCTESGTPHLYANLKDRWLTPSLIKMGLDEDGKYALRKRSELGTESSYPIIQPLYRSSRKSRKLMP